MSENNEIILKPCPFCGGLADYNFDTEEDYHEIICDNFDCRVSVRLENYEGEKLKEIAAIWNARAGDLHEENERLKDELFDYGILVNENGRLKSRISELENDNLCLEFGLDKMRGKFGTWEEDEQKT